MDESKPTSLSWEISKERPKNMFGHYRIVPKNGGPMDAVAFVPQLEDAEFIVDAVNAYQK